MKSYSSYKGVEIKWLDSLPIHWQVKPLFAVLRECQRSNKGNLENNVLSLSYGKIIRRDLSQNFGLLPESFETYQIVFPGNIVLRLTDLQNDKKSLRVGLVKEKGIITSAYTCLKPLENIDSNFTYYLLHAYDLVKVFYNEGAGVRQSITFKDLRRMPILLPSITEQQAIADFLDCKTKHIDRLIAKKQRQIELLQEQRLALINQVVTKGLKPDVEMKDSGVEWLGEVPVHWEIKWLKHHFNFEKGKDAQQFTIEYISSNVGKFPVYSGQTENEGVLGFIKKYIYNTPPVILVTTVGAKAMTTQLIEGKYSLSQNCALITAKGTGMDIRYFHYLLMCIFLHEKNKISLIMQPSLRFSDLAQYKIIFPPFREQKQIADFIDERIKRVDELIKKIRKQIQLYQEYRTALITEAVTGKIDVRSEK